ncbi:hypothetical protein EJB05_45149 [Eragrostis curvula]|uniref:Uncharacterized protein n=1 Tax=Eragrostis curvula TaxID=38414 RepID=A0A5J9TJF8_9POAL|nr:hypothetical protein EJB05_45149 [Eragrostis curvula]
MKTPLLSPWTQCAEGGHQVLRQDALGFPYLGLFPGLAVLPALQQNADYANLAVQDNIHSPFALSWDFCMRKWAPCHSVVAAPLLIAFKLLLCIYLESIRDYIKRKPICTSNNILPSKSYTEGNNILILAGGLLRRSALYSSPFY